MKTDIRITEYDGIESCTVDSVVYDSNGEVISVYQLSEHANLHEAFAHIDMMYRATLKPTLVKLKDGSYE